MEPIKNNGDPPNVKTFAEEHALIIHKGEAVIHLKGDGDYTIILERQEASEEAHDSSMTAMGMLTVLTAPDLSEEFRDLAMRGLKRRAPGEANEQDEP